MNIILVLLIILFLLMRIVGGERGKKSFFTLIFNFVILFIILIIISQNVEPIIVSIIGCFLISYTTLFYINGINVKTVSSLISVTLVVILTMMLTYKLGSDAKIQGFGTEQVEGLAFLSSNIKLNFAKIFICQVIIGLVGAIIDVSISISSSMNELYKGDTEMSQGSLFKSGMNIGKDILGTMTNTLLFAFISGFMTFIIFFHNSNYSFVQIMNAKVFCSEVFQILCSGIGIILIIPITAFVTSRVLYSKLPNKDLGEKI